MPLTRKQQILAKIESSEGQNANPSSADAVLVYEPTIQDEVSSNDRVPAGSTLSRDFVPMGRKSRTITFTSDMRGSGDTSIPIVDPEWGTLASASAYRKAQPVRVPVTSLSGTGYQVGEIVRKSANIRGVVLACFTGGTTLTHRLTANGDVVVAPIEGSITSTGTLTGESSGTTGTIGTIANYPGLVYQPTSQKLIQVLTGSWSASVPAVGDVLTIRASGVAVGHCQLIADNSGGTFDDIDVTLLDGTIANGNTLHFGANSATISAAPTMIRTPSLTLRHNLDGRRRDMVGARGNFELQGEAGGPLTFNWTFQGDPAASIDTIAPATAGLSSIRPPRLQNAVCAYGLKVDVPAGDSAVDFFRLPTKSVGLAAGNTISPNLDANSAGGSTGTNVTDRDPAVTVTTDQVHSGFDWEAYRDNAQAVRMACIVGTVAGNIVGFVVPNGQVLEANTGDSEGVAVHEINLRPRRVLEAGDDEVFLFQL